MILTGKEIEKFLGTDIIIEPFNQSQLNPNSYNLKLYNELLVYKNFPLDVKKKNEVEKIYIHEDGFLLKPNHLYLARTLEYTETKKFVPMLEGRSSVGRLGIYIHITAGFGDIGFCGYWTLEIQVVHPIIVYPYIDICQIFYHTPQGEITEYKSNKYQNNKGIQPSMMYKDF